MRSRLSRMEDSRLGASRFDGAQLLARTDGESARPYQLQDRALPSLKPRSRLIGRLDRPANPCAAQWIPPDARRLPMDSLFVHDQVSKERVNERRYRNDSALLVNCQAHKQYQN